MTEGTTCDDVVEMAVSGCLLLRLMLLSFSTNLSHDCPVMRIMGRLAVGQARGKCVSAFG
jgi:hypothetical protein